mgnify:CR=1 FL=1
MKACVMFELFFAEVSMYGIPSWSAYSCQKGRCVIIVGDWCEMILVCYIFSQGYSLSFFLTFAHLRWFLGLWSWIGFLGLGFSVDGVLGLWCGAFWVLWGWGSPYTHRRINLGKNFAIGM